MVGDQIRHVLRGVARRVHGPELEVANPKDVAIPQEYHMIPAHSPFALPVGPTLGGNEHFDGGIDRELRRPADKVGVNVRFSDGRHPQVVFRGHSPVLIHVAERINHDRLPCALAAD